MACRPSPVAQAEIVAPLSTTFKQGMRRLAGACTIITSVAPGQGREGWAGLTATAVASVTAEPARILVCINRSAWAHDIIAKSRVLGVNVLCEASAPFAMRFAGGVRPEEKFSEGRWLTGKSGAPLLAEALASFDCLVTESIEASTHEIFICDVLSVLLREPGGSPLIYFDGKFLPGLAVRKAELSDGEQQ